MFGKRLLICAIALGGCLFAGVVGGQEKINPSPNPEQQEAQRLWEQVIKAKGGRERLYNVTNLLRIEYPVKKYPVELYVFPDKLWEWDKHIFNDYPNVRIHNGNRAIFINPYEEVDEKKIDENDEVALRRAIAEESVLYLLETRWARPAPLKVTRQQIGKQILDVIRTRFQNAYIDFAVEPETLQVLCVRVWQDNIYQDKLPARSIVFSDYTEIDGIQIPQKESGRFFGKDGLFKDLRKVKLYPIKVLLNVEYRKELFERPPAVAEGPEAWKPSRAQAQN